MKKLWYFVTVLILIIGSTPYLYIFLNKSADLTKILKRKPEKEVWLNIFVHGTFGTALGVLSIPKVVKDDVKGSWYHEMIKDMRKDASFFSEQPILNKGLIQITPTFNLSDVKNKKLVAYPIIKSFDEIAKVANDNQTNIYYTFGWTGLMSQTRRRLESIRFYNEICEEIESYQKQGINPKIRILAHSHGGNLSLNLAAINLVLTKLTESTPPKWSDNSIESESLTEIYNLIKKLPNKETAKLKGKMKQFDYLPTNKNLQIQELVMLGVPIQPETEVFCKYDFFEKIYNLYSLKDYIQQIDFVSTKQGYSSQRINAEITQNSKKVVQARIMVNRSVKKEKSQLQANTQPSTDQPSDGLFSKVVSSAQAYLSDDIKDPSHKDLWFAAWGKENETFLAPLPIIIIVPLIIKIISQVDKKYMDFDVNLKQTKDNKKFKIQVSKYNEFETINEKIFPIETIEQLRIKLKKWDPANEEQDKNLALIFDSINMKFNKIV